MEITGKTINIPAVKGLSEWAHTLDVCAHNRRVKIYRVPEAVAQDRHFVAVTFPGNTEVVPPSRSKDTILLVDFSIDAEDVVVVNYINDAV